MSVDNHLREDGSAYQTAVGERKVGFHRKLTIKALAEKLVEIAKDKKYGYEVALLGVESIDYRKICALCKEGDKNNDPNLMPSKFMLLRDASDKKLAAKKTDGESNLCEFPYDLHKDAKETMSVRNLRRHLILSGFLDAVLDDSSDKDADFEMDTELYEAVCAHIDWAALAIEGPLEGGTHKVEKGDCLSDIAQKHGIREWRLLYELNKDLLGANWDVLPEGKELKLPDTKDNPLVEWFRANSWEEYLDSSWGYEYPGKYLSLTFLGQDGKPLVFKDEKGGKTTRRCEIYATSPSPTILHKIVLEGGDDLDVVIPDSQGVGLWIEGENVAFNGIRWPDFETFEREGLPAGAGGDALRETIDLPWEEVDADEEDQQGMGSMLKDGMQSGKELGRSAVNAAESARGAVDDLSGNAQEVEAFVGDVRSKADALSATPIPKPPSHPGFPRF